MDTYVHKTMASVASLEKIEARVTRKVNILMHEQSKCDKRSQNFNVLNSTCTVEKRSGQLVDL